MATEETFVYDNLEVKKTGRVAEKPVGKPGGRVLELFEITPANSNDGDWKKWVAPSTLFSIKKGP